MVHKKVINIIRFKSKIFYLCIYLRILVSNMISISQDVYVLTVTWRVSLVKQELITKITWVSIFLCETENLSNPALFWKRQTSRLHCSEEILLIRFLCLQIQHISRTANICLNYLDIRHSVPVPIITVSSGNFLI
jgi:hypothetical protein